MHIIIVVLGAIVTILWYLHRLADMGIDLGGLNPWLWARRRRWRQDYYANPIFRIASPMELTALLSVAVAKADGDMSSEEKQHLLHSFETVFQLSARDASDLLQSSSHLYGDGSAVRDKVEDVVQSCVEKFSEAQVGSALELLRGVADVGGAQTHAQSELLRRIESKLAQKSADGESWG